MKKITIYNNVFQNKLDCPYANYLTFSPLASGEVIEFKKKVGEILLSMSTEQDRK